MDNIVCIYKITNTVTGDFYIGQTINFHNRIRCHKNNPPPKMREDIKKYGWDAFKAEMVEECAVENLTEKERDYIKSLKPAYNTHPFDYTITEETRRKISEANTGRTHTEESCEKMSEKRLGVTLSDDHKEKCRQSSLGNKSRSKAVICVETGKVYPNAKTAAADVGLKSASGITGVLRGAVVTAGGYHWQYADEEDATKGSRKRSVAVLCEDTGEIFPTFEAAAKKFGICATTVSRIANGKYRSSLHFKLVEELSYNEIRDTDKRFGSSSHYTPIMCVETGQTFSGIKVAAEYFQISYQSISSMLSGKANSAGGFHFKYADGKSHKIVKRKVQCIETGVVYNNTDEAAARVNLSPITLANHLRGYKKSAGGFHWKYFEDEINEVDE